jgi:hypothetical protein
MRCNIDFKQILYKNVYRTRLRKRFNDISCGIHLHLPHLLRKQIIYGDVKHKSTHVSTVPQYTSLYFLAVNLTGTNASLN